MLDFKPHTWTATTPAGAPSTVRGQITPLDTTKETTPFGIVDLRKPFVALCDPEDADAHEEGGRVLWNGREFAIKLPPETYDEDVSECASSAILLDELINDA